MSLCEIDQSPLQRVEPPNPTVPPTPASFPTHDAQQIIDDEHLKMLSIFHFVIAGLALFGLLFLCLHFLIMSTIFTNPHIWATRGNSGPPPEFFKIFLGFFYLIFGGITAAAGVLNLLSAIFIRRRKHRAFSLVVAGLNCLQIPFGTILGVFTIIVLSRLSVRGKYGN